MASAVELLDLCIRWIHVIAGVMWIGNALLFNWLDRNLRDGRICLLHSGGFYFVKKTPISGSALPDVLHWFKWQAYATWMTGAALLVTVYYAGDRAPLARAGGPLTGRAAGILVGAGTIVAGWAGYEIVQRSVTPRSRQLAAALCFAGLAGIVIELTQMLDGRAAFLHVGALLGTIMAGNVRFTIIPSQRQLIDTIKRAGFTDPVIAARAKRVSLHNNYLTFPVVVLMVSNHFPALYGNGLNALLLLVLIAAGALARHALNVRLQARPWMHFVTGAIALVVGVSLLALRSKPSAPRSARPAAVTNDTVTFADVRHVIDRRCATCHSERPTDAAIAVAPAGVMFDTRDEIVGRLARIRERAVLTRTMPPANKTGISDDERMLIGRWADRESAVPH